MKAAIIVLIFLSSNLFGQTLKFYGMDEQKPRSTRVDTVLCEFVVANAYTVTVECGFRIDSVETWRTQVGCPDEAKGTRFGCAVLHYGDVDIKKSSSYRSCKDYSVVPKDRIIHIIEHL